MTADLGRMNFAPCWTRRARPQRRSAKFDPRRHELEEELADRPGSVGAYKLAWVRTGGTFARFAPDRSARPARVPRARHAPRLVGWRLQSALAQAHQSPHRRLLDVHLSPSGSWIPVPRCLPAAAGADGKTALQAALLDAARPAHEIRRWRRDGFRCTGGSRSCSSPRMRAARSSWADSPAIGRDGVDRRTDPQLETAAPVVTTTSTTSTPATTTRPHPPPQPPRRQPPHRPPQPSS